MPSAEATLETEHPSRYLVQLCRHASTMGHATMHHPGRGRHAGGAQARPDVLHADWSDTAGTLRLNWGQCTLRAGPGTLTLRVDAIDEDKLRAIQELLTANLERFGRRAHLTVTWQQQPETPAVGTGDTA